MLLEGSRARILGIPQATTEGTKPRGSGALGVPHQGQLPQGLHSRSDRRRLSRRRLVPFLSARCPGTYHPGTPCRGKNCSGIRVCSKQPLTAPNTRNKNQPEGLRLFFAKALDFRVLDEAIGAAKAFAA